MLDVIINTTKIYFKAFGKIALFYRILRTNQAKPSSQMSNVGSSILDLSDQLFHFKVNATNWQNDKISNL